MNTQDEPTTYAHDDIEVLVRLAGIQVTADRIPRLADELAFARRLADQISDAASRAPNSGAVEFDASWSDTRGRGRA